MYWKNIPLSQIIQDSRTGVFWSGNRKAYELFGSDLNYRGEDVMISGVLKKFPEIRIISRNGFHFFMYSVDWEQSDWLEAKRLSAGTVEFDSRLQIKEAFTALTSDVRKRQEDFISALVDSNGMLNHAKRNAGVSTDEYQKWMNDRAFSDMIAEVRELLIDDIEGELIKSCKAGDSFSIKYFLDHRAKDRGYGKDAVEKKHEESPLNLDLLTYDEQEQLKFLLTKAQQIQQIG